MLNIRVRRKMDGMHKAVVASHNIWARAVEACSPHDFQASAPQCMTIRAFDVLWRTLNLGGAQCTKPLKNGIPGYPTPTHHSNRNSPPPSSSSPIYLRLLSHYNPPLLPPPTLPPFMLGSAADRSPGLFLLGQNGGGGLSLNERSSDCMTRPAFAAK